MVNLRGKGSYNVANKQVLGWLKGIGNRVYGP